MSNQPSSHSATISVRPVSVIGHRFTDGENVYETANLEPSDAWAVFVAHADGEMTGLCPDRTSAISSAERLAEELGGRVTYIAPEGAAEAEGRRTLQ